MVDKRTVGMNENHWSLFVAFYDIRMSHCSHRKRQPNNPTVKGTCIYMFQNQLILSRMHAVP